MLWIEWENGVAYRRAYGAVMIEAWESEKETELVDLYWDENATGTDGPSATKDPILLSLHFCTETDREVAMAAK